MYINILKYTAKNEEPPCHTRKEKKNIVKCDQLPLSVAHVRYTRVPNGQQRDHGRNIISCTENVKLISECIDLSYFHET